MITHGNLWLRSKVLNDHLLNMSVALVQFANRKQRTDSIFKRLSDCNQNPGGEWNLQPDSFLNRLEPERRRLIRSIVVSHTRREQAIAGALQHQPHTWVGTPKSFQVSSSHQPWICVREQSSLVHYALAHLSKIGEGRLVSEPRERVAHFRKHRLGSIAETEQCFLTSQSSAGFGNCKDLIRHHRLRPRLPRISSKRAVPTIVSTEVCKRDEDLLRIGDPLSFQPIAQVASGLKQRSQLVISLGANQDRGSIPGHNSFARKRKRIIKRD